MFTNRIRGNLESNLINEISDLENKIEQKYMVLRSKIEKNANETLVILMNEFNKVFPKECSFNKFFVKLKPSLMDMYEIIDTSVFKMSMSQLELLYISIIQKHVEDFYIDFVEEYMYPKLKIINIDTGKEIFSGLQKILEEISKESVNVFDYGLHSVSIEHDKEETLIQAKDNIIAEFTFQTYCTVNIIAAKLVRNKFYNNDKTKLIQLFVEEILNIITYLINNKTGI